MKSVLDTACFVGCLLIALILRLVVILHEPGQLSVDRDAYLGIAASVAEGRGFSSPHSTTPTAYRPPLYPLLLATGFCVASEPLVVGQINLLAGLMTVCLTASLGKHLQLGRWRFLAAFLVSVDPLLVQYSARPMTESLCTLVAALWLWSIIGGHPGRLFKSLQGRDQILHGILIGVTFGLLVLCRPTFWLMAGLFAPLWFVFWIRPETDNGNHQNRWATAAGSVIGTCVTVLPWVVRNWLVFGVPILTTTHGGYTLLLGNNPVFYAEEVRQPWGTVWPDDSQRQWENDRRARLVQELGPDAGETADDDWNSRQAKSYIKANPGPTFEAVVHRVRSLWNTMPQSDAASGVDRRIVMAVGCYYSVVLACGFMGMVLILVSPQRIQWLPLFVLILSVQGVHLFYWTNTRMRAPFTPAISLFAAAVVSKRRVTGNPGRV